MNENEYRYFVVVIDTDHADRNNLDDLHELIIDGWRPLRERVMRSQGFRQFTLVCLERATRDVGSLTLEECEVMVKDGVAPSN